jgi:hypothetical protein
VQRLSYITKRSFQLRVDGTGAETIVYDVPPAYPGPCIIKLQAVSSGLDVDLSAGFDLVYM